VVNTAQTRTIAADPVGNAWVGSQLNGNGVQLDRLGAAASTFDTARSVSATGTSPGVAGLPDSTGAALIYTEGTQVYVTIQVY
jgi:hypothetical protein